MSENDYTPLWADRHEDWIDKAVPSEGCECVECGPSAAVYAKVAEDSLYDWRCASCGYTPESLDKDPK